MITKHLLYVGKALLTILNCVLLGIIIIQYTLLPEPVKPFPKKRGNVSITS